MYTIGYAAQHREAPLAPFKFERRALRPNDVAMQILYCGVCHSDLHQARDDGADIARIVTPGGGALVEHVGLGGVRRRRAVRPGGQQAPAAAALGAGPAAGNDSQGPLGRAVTRLRQGRCPGRQAQAATRGQQATAAQVCRNRHAQKV